jgi:hypothetical protein
MKIVINTILSFVFANLAFSQAIQSVAYTGNEFPGDYTPSISSSDFSATVLSPGSGLSYDPYGSYLGFTGLNSSTLGEAITNNDYYEFTVSLNPGASSSYLLDSQRSYWLTGNIQAWTDTAQSLSLVAFMNADGYSNEIFSASLDVSNPLPGQSTGFDRVGAGNGVGGYLPLGIQLDPGQSLTFRTYLFDAKQVDGSSPAVHAAMDDQSVWFQAVPVPEPSGALLVGLAGMLGILRRRRLA